jgi:hypothetical protein
MKIITAIFIDDNLFIYEEYWTSWDDISYFNIAISHIHVVQNIKAKKKLLIKVNYKFLKYNKEDYNSWNWRSLYLSRVI